MSLWRCPHGERLPGGMRRRLFVVFGVVITLSAIAAASFTMVVQQKMGNGSLFQRLDRMMAAQFARIWQDPQERAQKAENIAENFDLTVTLFDAADHELYRTGEGSGHTREVMIRRDGVTLGKVIIQPKTWRDPLILLAALLVFVALLWWASGRIASRLVRPLEHLAEVARDIGDGRLSRRARLGQDAAGEVGYLAGSINDMAGRIEQQLADQRALLATVSHELRTPLGHLRILLELAEEERDPQPRLAEMAEELVEMDSLVGELLASSRLDFRELHRRAVSPADLARRALSRSGVELKRLEIKVSAPETAQMDPTLIARALANLLDNARKHGGGVERICVALDGGELRFEVHDGGAGFDPKTREQLFTPFVDGGSERSALGLGLSLVRRIAEAHGGHAFAHNREDGGACFGLAIPLLQPDLEAA